MITGRVPSGRGRESQAEVVTTCIDDSLHRSNYEYSGPKMISANSCIIANFHETKQLDRPGWNGLCVIWV